MTRPVVGVDAVETPAPCSTSGQQANGPRPPAWQAAVRPALGLRTSATSRPSGTMPGPGPNPPSATCGVHTAERRRAGGKPSACLRACRSPPRRPGRAARSAPASTSPVPARGPRGGRPRSTRPAWFAATTSRRQRADAATHRDHAAEVEGADRRSRTSTASRPCDAPGPPRGRGAAGSGRRDLGRPFISGARRAATSASSVPREARRGQRAGRPPRSAAGAASARSYAVSPPIYSRPIALSRRRRPEGTAVPLWPRSAPMLGSASQRWFGPVGMRGLDRAWLSGNASRGAVRPR